MSDLLEHYLDAHAGKPRTELTARRAEIITRTAELEGYSRRSQAQAGELDGLIAEQIAVDDLIKRADVETRRAEIDRITRMAADESNLERPGGAIGAPAVVKGLGDPAERPAEVIQRIGNPWRDGGGPLNRETGAGLVSRAHSAIEGQAERLTHDGAEKLAGLLSERPCSFGPYEVRTQEDIARSAELVLALSSPHYETAFRAILRNPEAFRGGTGVLMWSDEERQAYTDVMACRAALIENTGTGGAYLLPLYLDPQIMLTNAGAANPWRRVCRNVTTTSSTWNGVTSAGVTAGWLAEGTVSSDNTPTLGQLVITPQKEAQWIMASFEEVADSDISNQVPALIADAFDRLEEIAFTTGSGSGQRSGRSRGRRWTGIRAC